MTRYPSPILRRCRQPRLRGPAADPWRELARLGLCVLFVAVALLPALAAVGLGLAAIWRGAW